MQIELTNAFIQPEQKTKPDMAKAVKKTKPLKAVTRNGLDEPKKSARPNGADTEGPLPVLVLAYHGKPVRLDPESIRISRWANRLPDFVDTQQFKDLVSDLVSTGGNSVPVLLRLLPDNIHELVYGHRRLEACKLAGLKITAQVAKGLTDEQAIRLMAHENSNRHDLSPLERGRWYAKLREEQIYKTDGELSRWLSVDKGCLSNVLALARLHPVIINAFSSPRDLQFRFAKRLTDASQPPEPKPGESESEAGEFKIESTEIYQRALAIAGLRSSEGPNLDGTAVIDMLLGLKPVQPTTARVKASRRQAISKATADILNEPLLQKAGSPGHADKGLPDVTVEVPSDTADTGPLAAPGVGPSNTLPPIFPDHQGNVEAVIATAADAPRYLPAASPEIYRTVSKAEAPKKPVVGRSNIWHPIITDDADEIGAVTTTQNGTAHIELKLGLTTEQCDLLAIELGKLLSEKRFQSSDLAQRPAVDEVAS